MLYFSFTLSFTIYLNSDSNRIINLFSCIHVLLLIIIIGIHFSLQQKQESFVLEENVKKIKIVEKKPQRY